MRDPQERGFHSCLASGILWLGAMVFLMLAVREYYPFYLNDKDLDDLREQVIEDDTKDNKRTRNINWKKLRKINPDIIAWIEIPGTKVDYPVLKSHTWNEYLHKDYKGKSNYLGSVFVQPGTPKDFSAFHTVVFGHNMRNQSMFGSLHRFEEKSFYQKHRKVYIYQPKQEIHAVVYSTYHTQDKLSSYQTVFKSSKERKQWIRNTRKYQLYPTKNYPEVHDKVITLSTCDNGRGHTARYVVHTMEKEVIRYDQ